MSWSTLSDCQPHWFVHGAPFGEPERYQTVVETAGSPRYWCQPDGEVEIPIAIDGRQRAGDVELDDFDLDADIGEGLLDEGREERHILAVLDWNELERETGPVGAALVARFVEKRFRLLFVEGVGRLATRIEGRRRGRDRTRRGLCLAIEEVLDEEIDVDGVRDGAPNTNVGEFLAPRVELKRVVEGVRLDSAVRHFETLVVLQPVEIRERQAIIGTGMKLARLERCGNGGLVGDDAPDDAVEIGILLAPVIRVALGDDELAALVLDELERSRADRRRVGGVLEDVACPRRRGAARCSRGRKERAAGG